MIADIVTGEPTQNERQNNGKTLGMHSSKAELLKADRVHNRKNTATIEEDKEAWKDPKESEKRANRENGEERKP